MTERTLLTSAGRPIRHGRMRLVITALAVVAAIALGSLLLQERLEFGWSPVWVGLSIAIAHVTVYLARLEPDSHGLTGEELPVVAALILAPEAVGSGIVVAAIALPLAIRRLAPLGRMRTASVDKVVFNVTSVVLAGSGGLLAADAAVGAGLHPLVSGAVGGVSYHLVTWATTSAVITATSGRPLADVAARVARHGSGSSLGLGLAGVVCAVLLAPSPYPAAAVLVVTVGVYSFARRGTTAWRAAEARERILREVPNVLGEGHDLDAATLETARRLINCREARLSAEPPALGEYGVPLADEGGRTYLIVGDRIGEHRSFDIEDVVLLENLATLARSARQHRRTLDQLRRSEETRTAIAGALAHDLRSPLSTVSTALTTLRRLGADLHADTREDLLTLSSANVDRALTILDDLLALERLATDPLTTTAGDVAAAVRAIVTAHDGEVQVKGGAAATVSLDQRVLERILDNLVSNARKHAPGTPVTIGWETRSDEVVVAVEDHGAGIPSHLRESLTRAFTQGDARVPGVGLGLHLARRFTELAGGRLEIGDAPEGGASVRIILPVLETSDEIELSSGKPPSSP